MVNHLIRSMLTTAPPARTWTRPLNRPKRALFLSSPIGLGHSARDVAIARELRRARAAAAPDASALCPPETRVIRPGRLCCRPRSREA